MNESLFLKVCITHYNEIFVNASSYNLRLVMWGLEKKEVQDKITLRDSLMHKQVS